MIFLLKSLPLNTQHPGGQPADGLEVDQDLAVTWLGVTLAGRGQSIGPVGGRACRQTPSPGSWSLGQREEVLSSPSPSPP